MPTWMQKIRLAIRGWNRRREEKEKEFLQRNVWGPASAGRPVETGPHTSTRHIDVEGLTVAYLDDSGHFQHYLDIETGDVIDTREPLIGDRYRRVPSHRGGGDEERRDFIMMVDDNGARARLTSTSDFRSELARDRALERAWYNFRNDRAIAAIEMWLREIGLK
ncbi:MAG TPA: hypothetical protein VJ853_09200 [Thermoanaerobaculia bacterium]|nr:hypothetical protein [Thermoanaerobaculia bacterium]